MSGSLQTFNFKKERLDVVEQSIIIHHNSLQVTLKFKKDFDGVHAAGIVVPDARENGYSAFEKNHGGISLIHGKKGDQIICTVSFDPSISVYGGNYMVAGGVFDTPEDVPVRAYLDEINEEKRVLSQRTQVNMNEKVFYNHGGIIVTRSRVIIGATTFSVNLISQVQLVYEDIEKIDKAYAPAVLFGCILFCAPLSIFTVEPDSEIIMDILIISCLISLIGFCIGIYYGTISKSKVKVWHLLLFTNSSQIKAYKSENKQEVIDIILAINLAISERG